MNDVEFIQRLDLLVDQITDGGLYENRIEILDCLSLSAARIRELEEKCSKRDFSRQRIWQLEARIRELEQELSDAREFNRDYLRLYDEATKKVSAFEAQIAAKEPQP